jgi:Helix-turn-helix domain
VSRGDEPDDHYATIAVARWLREWRTSTGASQRAVANLAGIDQGGLSRIERGLGGRPSGWRLARILVVLDWLSGGGDPAGPWTDSTRFRPDRLPLDSGPRPPPVVGVRSQVWDDEDGPYRARSSRRHRCRECHRADE